VSVIRHEHVGRNCEFKVLGVLHQLIDDARCESRFRKQCSPKSCARCKEISLVADVREAVEAPGTLGHQARLEQRPGLTHQQTIHGRPKGLHYDDDPRQA